ncbi:MULTISPECIES: hypothetical protein [unclassified Aeromicrobium]|uniref:hypothetical protein n=1 Tax=unclassified Aeromicrobium TaxID=2633570 RepID=UPI00257E21C4|nr:MULTISPECIES: hypothetical protein [unclassified Aeromicrobium]
MDAIRRHPFVVVGFLAGLALLAALLVPMGGSGAGGRDAAAADDQGVERPGLSRPTPSPSMSAAASDPDAEPKGLAPRSVTGLQEPAGLPGSGGTFSVRARRITLSATSSEPIGVVGYLVPTSRDRPSGTATGVGTSWSMSTLVYGRPDYAQMFMQAGPSGATITCTITVDGRVTEQRSSAGPYGQLFCQG